MCCIDGTSVFLKLGYSVKMLLNYDLQGFYRSKNRQLCKQCFVLFNSIYSDSCLS